MRFCPLIFLLFFAACQEQDVHVYRIAKEQPGTVAGLSALIASSGGPLSSPAVPGTDMRPLSREGVGATAAAETSGLPIQWKVPAGWRESPASGMRAASFAFAGSDISVVAIPGEAGGELANVNRWRGQLGLAPFNDKQMSGASIKVKSAAGSLLVVDFTGVDPKGEIQGKARLLGAILSLDDKQWFFKVMGTEPSVGKAKPSFMDFLRSLKRASNS